ncbi:glycogen-binding subunit 76A [Schistocerca gregaria]|uniref:glycogen-binding subunit 76A n=1 Tax=Schistocerca gregaria TaxID=7010 RepID=UPI00211EB636|nr:glycogen-binding subunit 76A [Schistocerca gregaria]
MLSGERMTAEQQGQPPQPQPEQSPSHQPQQSSCGLGSLLSAGCRGRAEAFARRLSRRLQTLGMGGGAGAASADEERPFWAAPPSQPQPLAPVQVQLARVPSDADVFYDPVDSPVEVAPPAAVAAPLQTCSSDSDSSEVLFFDPESSTSNCSSAGEDEAYAAYNGRAASSGSESTSTSTSDTGTLSGLSSSSSSAVHVQLPGHASASDDSRSTRTPSEETRSSPRSQSASDDSRPLSELSALEPTPSSYSTLEDSVATAEFSVLEDGVPPQSDRLKEMPEEEAEEALSAVVRRLGLTNGEAGHGGCDCVVRLHSGKCVIHHSSLRNGTDALHHRPESEVDRLKGSDHQEDSNGAALNGDSETEYERTFVSVDLQMNCQLDAEAEAPVEEGGVTDDDGPRERIISEEKSAENLRALCEEVSGEREERHEEATNGVCVEADASQQVECLIVVSPEPEDEAEAQQEKERPPANGSGSGSASNDEDDDSRPQRVRRCSSLKSGKTPPGTPGRKKIVRFADVLGLDLADVRTFLDEIPKIPSSAYDDLRDVDLATSASSFPPAPTTAILGDSQQQSFAFPTARTLVPLFQQPWTQPDFLDRVRDRQVCLESATLQDPALLSLSGVVRVRNLDFHKSVHVRYTMDGWRTWADAQARYVDGSCDGFSDRFSFVVYADALPAGGRLELAVRFQCRGAQFWDSNGGANYAFQCVASAAAPAVEPLSPVDDRWPSFY